MLVGLLLLPLAYLAFLIARAIRGQREGLIVSLALFTITIASDVWVIMQSRSSTAGIGMIFLPALATVAGALAVALGVLRHSDHRASRMLGMGLLVAAFVPSEFSLVDARRTVARKNRRDADELVRDGAYERYRAELAGIRAGASINPDTLDQLIRARRNDREFLPAALEHDGIAAALLDTLARSSDVTIVRKSIGHRNVRAETLARVYRSSVHWSIRLPPDRRSLSIQRTTTA